MDDSTGYGNSFDDCLDNLSKVLDWCIESDLVLNFDKCHFMASRGIFLGHVISEKGIEVDQAKIAVIANLPYPTNVREVHSFLGHVGFYHMFIKDFNKIALLMTTLLQKDMEFSFNDECKKAFGKIKAALISASIVQASRWDLPFDIMCDTRNYAVGAVLGKG